jgi:hypothetical protein
LVENKHGGQVGAERNNRCCMDRVLLLSTST